MVGLYSIPLGELSTIFLSTKPKSSNSLSLLETKLKQKYDDEIKAKEHDMQVLFDKDLKNKKE